MFLAVVETGPIGLVIRVVAGIVIAPVIVIVTVLIFKSKGTIPVRPNIAPIP
jgi:hypothetical protein